MAISSNGFNNGCVDFLGEPPDTSNWSQRDFEQTRDKLCDAVLYKFAAQTRGDTIHPQNRQISTWDDLLGDIVSDTCAHARGRVIVRWTTQLIGRPYQRLYATAATVLESSKVQILNRRIAKYHEVAGSHERTVTSTPPNYVAGGFSRARPATGGAYSYCYDPTDGMSL